MINPRRLLRSAWAAIFLLLTYPAYAQSSQWETATNTGQKQTGQWNITRCLYRTIGGFEFSTNEKGLCPFSVKVNPQTMEVK